MVVPSKNVASRPRRDRIGQQTTSPRPSAVADGSVPIARAVVVSGSGRYADPWHPFAETSAAIAAVLAAAGLDVTVDDQVDTRLADVSDVDLLVLNIGAVDEGDDARDAATRRGLLAYVASGRPLLACHSSATSLQPMPEWEDVLGGIWVRGTTMHPPWSRAHVLVDTDAHPITSGVPDFEIDDERYTHLRVSPAVTPLAWHEHEGARHPLMWTHMAGRARVVYDALGHDAASYAAAEHRTLIAQAAAWLLG